VHTKALNLTWCTFTVCNGSGKRPAMLLWAFIAGFCCPSVTAQLQAVAGEGEALAYIKDGSQGLAARCTPDDGGLLINRGWWSAARELVLSAHQKADAKFRASLETVVRREVGAMKQKADALLLALAPQDDSKIGIVRCSFQWAQNSSAIFLTMKFSHRWSSPGALKVHDEKASVSDCCFNFSASGEHSQLRKRYTLDLKFFKEVDTHHWYWQHASAGRVTIEIRKKEPGKWTRLLATKDKPGNMAVWDAMYGKWSQEVAQFERAQATAKKAAKEGSQGDKRKKSKAEIDGEDEQRHEDGRNKCHDNVASPFYRERETQLLCEAYWPPAMKGKRGTDTLWLVLFFSPGQLACRDREKKCVDVHSKWTALAKKVEEYSRARVGVVDCDLNQAFCDKQKVGHMPFVRRYKDGKRTAYYEEWEIDSVMKFVSA